MSARAPIPKLVETKVLTTSQRKCCLCYYLKDVRAHRKGQIAHLNRDPSDSGFENLVWLCLEHHDEYDSRTSQSKGLTLDEVRSYRDRLYQELGPDSTPTAPAPDHVIDQKPAERVVWCLPRGIVLLDDITFDAHEGWATLAHYYHFGEGWRTGTHFHASYLRHWEEGDRITSQFYKVGIPIGDWDYSYGPFTLMTRLRCTSKTLDIKSIVEQLIRQGNPVRYYAPSEPVLASQVEGRYPELNRTHAIRDLLMEMKQFENADYTFAATDRPADEAFSLGHRALLEAETFLGKKHTSLRFVGKVVDEYDRKASPDSLKRWVKRLRDVLIDAATAGRPGAHK